MQRRYLVAGSLAYLAGCESTPRYIPSTTDTTKENSTKKGGLENTVEQTEKPGKTNPGDNVPSGNVAYWAVPLSLVTIALGAAAINKVVNGQYIPERLKKVFSGEIFTRSFWQDREFGPFKRKKSQEDVRPTEYDGPTSPPETPLESEGSETSPSLE